MLRRAPSAESHTGPERRVLRRSSGASLCPGTAIEIRQDRRCAHTLARGARGLGVKGGAAGLIGGGIELGVKGGAAGLIGRVGIELGVKGGAAGLIFGAVVLVGAGLGGMGGSCGSVGGSSIGGDG